VREAREACFWPKNKDRPAGKVEMGKHDEYGKKVVMAAAGDGAL
jgi:hypothetical protein